MMVTREIWIILTRMSLLGEFPGMNPGHGCRLKNSMDLSRRSVMTVPFDCIPLSKPASPARSHNASMRRPGSNLGKARKKGRDGPSEGSDDPGMDCIVPRTHTWLCNFISPWVRIEL